MKESGKERLKSTIYESTLSTADAVPLPRWGRQISSGYAANIYGAMPEGGEQSPATRNLSSLLSNYWVQRVQGSKGSKGSKGSGGGFAEIEGSGRSCSGIRYLTYDVSRRSG